MCLWRGPLGAPGTEVQVGTTCKTCGTEGATWGGLCWDCQMARTGGNWAEQMNAAEECGWDGYEADKS